MQQERFLDAISVQLGSKGFQVPGHWKDVDLRGQVEAGKVAAKIAQAILSGTLGVSAPQIRFSGTAKEKEIVQAVSRIAPLANLVGFRVAGAVQGQSVIAVILADHLSATDVTARFPEFMAHAPELARIGYRINYQTLGVMIHPIAVYFDQAAYSRNADAILSGGWQTNAWRKLFLKAAAVDASNRHIEWARPTGLARIGYSLGVKNEPFDDNDVSETLKRAGL